MKQKNLEKLDKSDIKQEPGDFDEDLYEEYENPNDLKGITNFTNNCNLQRPTVPYWKYLNFIGLHIVNSEEYQDF